ncbi:STAS domain-containing protein [Nocardioides sp. DS6]|uniref:STAS domain-containing protein n=1 Tax=Nocardioides eburneus TaxID=3231482 RepID=A0ABV3SVN7_9ACTN
MGGLPGGRRRDRDPLRPADGPRRRGGPDPAYVVIDFTDAHIWDASTVAALDAVTTKYQRHGTTVDVRGLNEASTAMYERLSGHLAGAH